MSSARVTARSVPWRTSYAVAPWVPVILTALFLAWGWVTGMAGGHLLTATLAVLVTQVLPGVLVWRLVRPAARGWWAEDVGMGFAVGSALALLAQIPAGLAGTWWLSGALMLLLCVVLLAVPASRARIVGARTQPLPWWWGPGVAATFLVSVPQLRSYFRLSPLEWADGARALHIDTYLHIGLAGQLAHRGPTTFPWVKSEPLGYHWFSHAWMAQVGVTSGAGLDEVMLRFMPLLMAVVVPLAVAVAAVRLTGAAWAGPVAAFLAVGTGMMNVLGSALTRSAMTPFSPSLGLSAPMLVATVVLLCMRWRGTARLGSGLLLLVMATAAAGTKGSTTPLVVAGIGLAGLAMIVQRQWPLVLRLLVDGVITVAGLAIALVFVFRGSGAGLHLSLTDAAAQTWGAALFGSDTVATRSTDTVLAVVGVVTPGILGLVLLLFANWRRRPLVWVLLGSGAAGAVAISVFAHPGKSQYYFSLNAVPLLALLATIGLVVLERRWPRPLFRRCLVVGAAGGVVATWGPAAVLRSTDDSNARLYATLLLGVVLLALTALVAALLGRGLLRRTQLVVAAVGLATVASGVSITWDQLRDPTPEPAAAVPANFPTAATRGQIQAARWIRDHSGRHDLVMTNRHCTRPVSGLHGCDSRRWLVTAYTERQVLLEGWTATPRSAEEGPHGRDSITVPYWHPALLELNDGFIARPTRAAAEDLGRRGVRWVFVDHTRPYARSLAPYAELRRRFRGVDVYELNDPTNASASS